ncbi:hypothetical protein D3C72_1050340 [compost metagenome]
MKHPKGGAAQICGHGVGHHGIEQALRTPHVQPPQCRTQRQPPEAGQQGKRQIGQHEQHHARCQYLVARQAVRQHARRVGRQRIGNAHDHQHQWRQHGWQARIDRPQHQKSLAEARQRHHHPNGNHPPVAAAQALHLGPAERHAPRLRGRHMRGLLDEDHQNSNRNECRQHRQPEDQLVVVGRPPHQQHRQQWAGKGANRIERLAQAIGGAPQLGRRDIGHQRIAWRAPYALADAVDKTRPHQPFQPGCQRKHRFGERPQAIANARQQLALAKPVADGA